MNVETCVVIVFYGYLAVQIIILLLFFLPNPEQFHFPNSGI
jgi:hypothetical protein